MIYVDLCTRKVKEELEKQGIKVILRDNVLWDIPQIMTHICDPEIKLIVINSLNELSISEITLASLFVKKILVTDNLVLKYDFPIKKMIDFIKPECNLNNQYNNFIEWYKNYERNII